MDSFEANKIFGALLGTVFVLFGGSLLAENIFHSAAPEQPGYVIEAPEPGEGGAAVEVVAVPIAALLQSADAEAGSTVFRRCQSCHSNEDGAPAGVGPHLWGVVDRVIAEDPGFSYSAAMEAFSEGATVHWDYEHLNAFLINPRQHVPGTSMGFAGISNDSDRANLIAYLRTLSNDPSPLPEPPAEEAAAPPEGEAAAEGEAAPAEGQEAAPAEGTTAPEATTDPNAQQQIPASSDPRASGAAPISENPTTGQATDADAAEPNIVPEGQTQDSPGAAEPAPAEPAPSAGEAAPAAPQGTTIVPAQ